VLLLPGKVQCAKCDCHFLRGSFSHFFALSSPVPGAPWGVPISVSLLLHFIRFSPLSSGKGSGERNAKYIFSFLIDARSSHKNNAINDNPAEPAAFLARLLFGGSIVSCLWSRAKREPGICSGMLANIGILCQWLGDEKNITGEVRLVNLHLRYCFSVHIHKKCMQTMFKN